MKRTLSTISSDENSSRLLKTNNQSPVVDLLIEAIKENGNKNNKDEEVCGYKCEKRPRYMKMKIYSLTIDEASQVIGKNKGDIINAKCREKVKN